MREVEVLREPIELYKLLKLDGMASSGGEAKAVIAEGLVLVNGEVETRKRKQIFSGDIVKFGEEEIRIRKQKSQITNSKIQISSKYQTDNDPNN